ncbi:helix-turn-helix transcriptional regulator [Rhizobium leucaenae]|uniref:Transcriptional regulator with XRE-family HTH domain n=1 Tax=Rhizobium leucaenae TaxID=29450 RepID=A0A7W6ZP91_9HYPH|nr:helix-turn-helix transcriptional regulator [Rhizobium leucaenae]MBB4566030.1 transcriptional regulator with XRE-family HTH domain [Rhizobium leucaenae]MBB6302343.1 transcriptional regulator with XRE-family HTH domain [Rhizobium leucaenae]
MPATNDKALGTYLRDRRTKLDPAAFGLPPGRRRTAGLRREEVAQRANISATWYTWLEQGRGGAPSADVLDRITRALMLTDVEREHLFLLALGRPPEVRYQPAEGVTPRLQRVLDSLELSPALVKNSAWDIIAWNYAASVVLANYGDIPPEERNILRLVFSSTRVRNAMPEWEADARFVVAAFRTEVARAGAAENVKGLVEDLSRRSPEFEAMWRSNDVRSYGEGTKHLQHPIVGLIALEYSSFSVDGRPDLGMVVYNPATLADMDKVRSLLQGQA